MCLHVDAVHADGPAQGGIVGHRVGPSSRGQPQAAIEQPVPDRGGAQMIGETHRLVVVHLAQRGVDDESVRESFVPRRIDVGVERMHVAHQAALRVCEVRYRRVVRPGARHGREGIRVVPGEDRPL